MRTLTAILLLLLAQPALAESQDDYPGVSDPFGDPGQYEFAEDEREDKEFFHLGRYMMIGLDAGVGIFTGALGTTTAPGPSIGLRLVYFFDKSIALEAAGHFSNHIENIIGQSQSQAAQIEVNMIPLTLGFRYYFDTKSAPKAIAIANPYLVGGGGAYIRQQTVLQQAGLQSNVENTTTNAFGGFGGAGVEFQIYRRHVYLGVDLRYHLVFFPDEADGLVFEQDRAGDYFTGLVTLTYNF